MERYSVGEDEGKIYIREGGCECCSSTWNEAHDLDEGCIDQSVVDRAKESLEGQLAILEKWEKNNSKGEKSGEVKSKPNEGSSL